MSNISKVHFTIHASFIYCPCGQKKISKKLQSLIKFTLPPPTGRLADFLQPLNGSRNFTFLPQSFLLLSTLALMIPCMSLVNSKLCRGGKSCPTFIILSSSALSRSPQLPSGKNIQEVSVCLSAESEICILCPPVFREARARCGVGNNIPISEYPGTRNRSASSLSRFSTIQTLFTFSAEEHKSKDSTDPCVGTISVIFAEVGFVEVALDSRPCELCHCSR